MTKAEITALADRVEALTGLDREVDATIYDVFGDDPPCSGTWPFGQGSLLDSKCPLYTASLDASMGLVPDGDSFTIGQNVHHKYWQASVNFVNEEGEPQSRGCSNATNAPALALTAAALRAIAASMEDE